MKIRSLLPRLSVVVILTGLGVWCYRQLVRPSLPPSGPRTVAQIMKSLGPAVDSKLAPVFQRAGVSYPPKQITLIAFKAEKRLEIFASNESAAAKPPHSFRFIFSRPILAASGGAGPKLREGDRQVPEGFYRIELLNPNSRFHLSLRVNYPNDDDIRHAMEEDRSIASLGGDIMIHGGAASVGCLAMGDPAVEELFILAARTGLDNISLLIVPWDFRAGKTPELPPDPPPWTTDRHEALRQALEGFSL